MNRTSASAARDDAVTATTLETSPAAKPAGRLLARNTVLNFIGQFLPAVVALFTVPFVIHRLGAERFGVLSLVALVLGYFSLLDFGVGRATTKFVAEALGKGESREQISRIFWTSLALQGVLGTLGGLLLCASTPFLVRHVLTVPAELISQSETVFLLCSISVLVTLVTGTLSGLLEAHQRFDIVNALRTPSTIATYALPVVVLLLGGGLPAIVICLTVKSIVFALIFFFYCGRLLAGGGPRAVDFRLAPTLFKFGSWLTAVYVLSAMVTYLDRFLIASRLSTTAVTYYAPPYEIVSRLWILPQSLFMTLFPAFAAMWGTQLTDLERLFCRSFKYLVLSASAAVALIIVLAHPLLLFWLGPEFAARSTLVLQLLAVGFLLNSQAWVPSTLLMSMGRPDLVAKLFLLEAPFYFVGAYWMIGKFGIVGAAAAWAIRGGVETIIFFITCWRVASFRSSMFIEQRVVRLLPPLLALLVGVIPLRVAAAGQWWHGLGGVGWTALFAIVSFRFVLDRSERAAVTSPVMRFWRQRARLPEQDSDF